MATNQTDFREYRRGIKPEDWTERVNTGSASRIEGAAYDLPHRNVLQLRAAAAGATVLTWNAPDSDAGLANQEVLCRVRVVKDTAAPNVAVPIAVVRAADSAKTYYAAQFNLINGFVSIGKCVAGVASDLVFAAKVTRVGGIYMVRLRANSTLLQLWVWDDGTPDPGSGSWNVQTTDSSIATGHAGLVTDGTIGVPEVGYFAVGTNGDTAPPESTLALPLDQWCMLPNIIPEVTIGVERADPATGVVSKKWYTSRGPRHTGPGDYPPNTEFESVIVNAGGFGQRLEADALFGAQALSSIQQVELRNLPTVVNGPGLLDDWDNYTFAARPLEIRVGDMTKPHRSFELLATPDIDGEPAVTPEKVTIQLSNPAGHEGSPDAARRPAALKQALRVRTYIGIPTGVSILTVATSGASAPSNAAYDLASFVVCGRFRTTGLNNGGGSGASSIAARQLSGTNRQFQVFLYWLGHATLAGKLQVDLSVGGVSTGLGQSALRYDDGLDHWWALGIKDLDRYYVLVDGVSVLSGAMTGSVNLPAAPWTWATGAKDGLFFDHRMSTWLTEDEVRAAMATRLPQPPPANWVALWPGDDATGNTATDYSATANNATLAGVASTNFRWDPTDDGMPEQAGRPMPLALGVLFNAKAEMIDSLRGRLRMTDTAIPAGTAVSPVKARGLPITLTTDYTLPTPGVIDMVTAQSEPVTFDLAASASPESTAIHLPQVIADAMVARHVAGTPQYLDTASFEALRKILPYRGGGKFSEPPTGEDLLNLLGPLGAHYFQGRSGRVAAGYLLPPVNPGPYGQDTLLEFLGQPNRGVTFSAHSGYSLKQDAAGWSLVAWFKVPCTPLDKSTSSSFTYFPNGMTLIDRCGLSATGYYLGIDGRTGYLIFGAPGVTGNTTGFHYLSLPMPLLPDRWILIAAQQTAASRIMVGAIYNENLVAFTSGGASEATTGTMTDPTNEPLYIGHGPRGSFVGSIVHAFGDSPGNDPTLSILALDDGRPLQATWSPRFWIELRDGDGDLAVEAVQSRYGRIEGARWCPRLTLDFRTVVEPEFAGQLRMRSAWKSSARFRHNHDPVTGADVAATVTGAQRAALETPWLGVPIEEQAIRDVFRDSRELLLETLLDDRVQALTVATSVRKRFDPNRRTADARKWRKDALRLQLTDEILLYHHRAGLSAGKACRIASLSTVLGPEILTDITNWR